MRPHSTATRSWRPPKVWESAAADILFVIAMVFLPLFDRWRFFLRGHGLGGRHALDLVRLQRGQHVAGEAADLLDEHSLGHGAPVEADLHHVGASTLGGRDDALG